jgi:hypothetical protein
MMCCKYITVPKPINTRTEATISTQMTSLQDAGEKGERRVEQRKKIRKKIKVLFH